LIYLCDNGCMNDHGLSTADLVKASQAARMLGVHPQTLARWADSGVIRAVLVGPARRRHYYRADIDTLLHEGAA
jgi:excisionase family DNA binding protein